MIFVFLLICACSLNIAARSEQEQSSQISTAQVAQIAAQVRSAASGDSSIIQAVVVGQSLTREGRFAEADELFNAVLEKSPRNARALYGAALAAFNLGRTAQAESLARSTVDVLLPGFPLVPGNLSLD